MDNTNKIQDILSRAGNYIHGRDSEDGAITYTSILEWKELIGLSHESTLTASSFSSTPNTTEVKGSDNSQGGVHIISSQKWYQMGFEYWENERNCPATVDGVLGGFACLSKKDLDASLEFMRFLKATIRPQLKFTKEENDGNPTRACECGAGIGRVSKGLLLPLGITQCDLVESSSRLISSAPDYIGENSSKCRYFCTPLQDFEPTEQSYDIIWIQWVIGYLTDDDLIHFLKRCATGLRCGGIVVIKDNTCEQDAFIVHHEDASCTRSHPYVLAIAELAGFRVVYQRFQQDFPSLIFPVPMIALEPKIS